MALYHDSSLKRSGVARVNEGSHSFACHRHVYPQVEWTIPAFTPQPQSITALWLVLISCPAEDRRLSWSGWLGEILRWFLPPKMVTHPSTNRDRRRVTSLIRPNMLPLRHVATQQSTIRKTCPCNMVSFSPLAANIFWRVWDTAANSTGFTSWLLYYPDVGQRRSTKLCSMFGCLMGWSAI